MDELGATYPVFVYGTLKRNEFNHHWLEGAELVEARCHAFGRLYDTTWGFPAMVLDSRSRTIGEMYQVDCRQLALLDRLEGYRGEDAKNLYERVITGIDTTKGIVAAYAYVFRVEQVKGMKEIKCGDWVRVS